MSEANLMPMDPLRPLGDKCNVLEGYMQQWQRQLQRQWHGPPITMHRLHWCSAAQAFDESLSRFPACYDPSP